MTPRIRESRTHLDMSIGSIAPDTGTKGGIRLGRSLESRAWMCFCEMKWESDISPGVTNDPNRNQLVRVIESALYFQDCGAFADEVYVALVTPAISKHTPDYRKLYQHKFKEYETNSNILEDLRNCKLPPRKNFDAATQIGKLQLRWPTFDELFTSLPDSDISEGLHNFWQNYGSYLNTGQ